MQSVTTSLRPPHHRWDAAGWRRGKGVTPSTRSQSWHPRHPTISRVANGHRAVGTNNRGGGWAEGSLICGGACAHLAVVTDQNYRDYKTLA